MHCAVNILALHMSRPCQGDEGAVIPKDLVAGPGMCPYLAFLWTTIHQPEMVSAVHTLKRSVHHKKGMCSSDSEKFCMYTLKMSVMV